MTPPPRRLPAKQTRVSAKQRRAAEASTKAVAVLRVSTATQEISGLGLAAQSEAVASFARDHGLELVDVFSDTTSGKTRPSERDGMSQAMALLASGQAGVLLAARADRLTRVTSDLYALMDLSSRQQWCIRTADDTINTCSESGQLMAKVAGLFAEQERKLISARTREALQAKKAQGKRLGAPVTTSDGTRNRIRELRLDGQSMQEISRLLNRDGVPTARGKQWTWQNIQRVCNSLRLDDEAAGTVSHRPVLERPTDR